MNAYREGPPHNPTVETQKPGWSVYDPIAGVFVVATSPPGSRQVFELGDIGRAKVYTAEWMARADAAQLKGTIVTRCPRHNGHCLEAEPV